MLKKVLLLSISLGTISNSISMNDVIYRYNIPITSITMGTLAGVGSSFLTRNPVYNIGIGLGTLAGLGSRLYTNNIKYNIGIGLGIGIGTGISTYFISKLFSKDEQNSAGGHGNPNNPTAHSARNGNQNNIDEIDQEELQKELNSLDNGFGIWHKNTLEEMNKFDIENGNHKELLQVILKFGHLYSKNGSINIFKSLINKGLDINVIIDNYNNTPLHYAVDYKNTSIEKYLIDKGANTDAKNNGGRTAYQPCQRCCF